MGLSIKISIASHVDRALVTEDGTKSKTAPASNGMRGWSQTQAIMGKQFLNLIKYATELIELL